MVEASPEYLRANVESWQARGAEDLVEVRPPAGTTTSYPFVTAEWAARWPVEEIWRARRR